VTLSTVGGRSTKPTPKANEPALQKLLKAQLYPYQAEGALFAARAGRCLIADEMGLGKTIQAIATAELLTKHFGAERVLIVCPTSLKHQCSARSRAFRHGRRKSWVAGGLRGYSATRSQGSAKSPITRRWLAT